jgi:hypothetical protein
LGQEGLNLNPAWSPDGKEFAYISDRNGTANIYMYNLSESRHYQITNVRGAVGSFTEYSPALSWSRQMDQLAFTYFERGEYTVWSMLNPRSQKQDLITSPPVVATTSQPTSAAKKAKADSLKADSLRAIADRSGVQTSVYRDQNGVRASAALIAGDTTRHSLGQVSIASLLGDPTYGLPDSVRFKDYPYRSGLHAERISTPSIGYTSGNYYGSGLGGTTQLDFSDLLGNHTLSVAAAINGRLSDAVAYTAYTNLSRRTPYVVGAYQEPYYLPANYDFQMVGEGVGRYTTDFYRIVSRKAFAVSAYPLNRFNRFEFGIESSSMSRSVITIQEDVYANGYYGGPVVAGERTLPTLWYYAPSVAYVFDNTRFGWVGAVDGRRYRASITPAIGGVQWTDYLLDYRRYDPIVFGFITFATRLYTNQAVGRDENLFQKYIGRSEYVRGYDNTGPFSGNYACASYLASGITGSGDTTNTACATAQLVGTRTAVANAELRFPLIQRLELGFLPLALPPVEAALFYDAGLAWEKGMSISMHRPADYDYTKQRYVLTSYGIGFRVNLFGLALLRWDYARPMGLDGRKWNWTLGLGPAF